MTPTTHIAASCLMTACLTRAGAGPALQATAVSAGSLALHLAMDLIPHGFVATPETIFRKPLPTLIEVVPGPLIFAASIWMFGHPLLFVTACFFGILPDIVAVLVGRDRPRAAKIPGALALYRLHRRVHWFELEQPDGSYVYIYPNRPLLAAEGLGVCVLVALLLAQGV